MTHWNWLKGGIALGAVFLLAVWLVKPIGVSTQFVIFDGIVWNLFSGDLVVKDARAEKGYSSPNAYLNKGGGKYARSVARPVNYSFVFILAMILGGLVSSRLQKSTRGEGPAAPATASPDGSVSPRRYLFAFFGGVLALFGSRLAGGCTSGHMMSGMMQTSVSGYLFAMGAFSAGIPLAIFLYRTGTPGKGDR